jgi:hypothetical protein
VPTTKYDVTSHAPSAAYPSLTNCGSSFVNALLGLRRPKFGTLLATSARAAGAATLARPRPFSRFISTAICPELRQSDDSMAARFQSRRFAVKNGTKRTTIQNFCCPAVRQRLPRLNFALDACSRIEASGLQAAWMVKPRGRMNRSE